MAAESKKPPAFLCPACGQKHRADLSLLTGRPGLVLKATCRGCGIALGVSLAGPDEVRCVVAQDAPPTASTPASTGATGAPAPTPPGKAPAPPDKPAGAAAPALPTKAQAAPPRPEPKAPDKPAQAPAAPEKAKEKSAGSAPPGPVSARTAAREKDREKEKAFEEKSVADAEFAPGTSIGRYRIEEAIGRGGTGTVYRAFDPTTNRAVALKVLLADLPESMRQRFLREIEVQANIRHPNIMPVFDRGAVPDGRPFFTMELLYRPFTLTEIVERRERGTLGRYATLRHLEDLEALVREILVPVADGMYVANVENGVIHRDLKPDNVLVDSRTLRAYVIDFGICQVLERSGKLSSGVVIPPTAEEAGIVGTPRFLSPEQSRGSVHARTDVWGLGALVHFAITGEPPIAPASGITRAELQRRVEALREARETAAAAGDERKAALCDEKLGRLQAEGLRTLDDLFRDAREGRYAPLPSSAPAALAALARKAMAPEPADRYVNARQIATELSAWAKGGKVRALSEAGGAAAAVDTAKRTLRGALVPTLTLLLGGAVGWALGGGVGAGALGLSGGDTEQYEAELDDFTRELDAVSRLGASLAGPEAGRLHGVLTAQGQDLKRRLSKAPASLRAGFLERVAYQQERIAPGHVNLKAPEGYEWVAERPGLDGVERVALTAGDGNRLPPGDWAIRGLVRAADGDRRVERVRIPLRLPFVVRAGGVGASREAPVARLDVPLAPQGLPASMALVVGQPVMVRQAPFGEPSVTPKEVRTFLLGRTEVSNSEYAQFLRGLPEGEARDRTPSVAFVIEPGSGRSAVIRGAEDMPVVGLRPEDARAYAVWKGAQEGVAYRLPTEAEWLVAGGAPMGYELPAGKAGFAHEGTFEPTFSPVGGHPEDVGLNGERGLLGNAREMVEPVEGDLPSGAVLVKGAGVGDRPDEAMLYRVRVLKAGERHPTTGFRLARSLGP